MKQRTWLLKKVGALSRSVIFDGAEILNCWSSIGPIAKLLGALASLERKVSTKEDWYGTKFGPHPKKKMMGLKSTQCWPESERTLAAIASRMFWWGILRKGSIRTTCNLPLQVVKHLNQRRWWLYKSLGPIQNYNFWWGSNQTVLTWVRKNYIEPNVLVRHLAQEFHLNNM